MKQKFLEFIAEKAKEKPASIVFPETRDPRVLEAAYLIAKAKTGFPVLLGNPKKIDKDFKKLEIKPDATKLKIIDIEAENEKPHLEKLAQELFKLRKEKGLSLEEARKLVRDPNYFGVMLVKMGEVDGLISGSICSSAETLRPALQIIKTKERFHKVSAFFFMIMENRLLLFADCMVNIEPSSNELADIAIDSANTAERFGFCPPKIAMLSFSTNGSAKHPNAGRVREATLMVQDKRPDLICEGEMQVDAALVPEICARKFPKSKIKGDANILIFPNLDAANISYKLVQRLAGAQAIGPIIQGLDKPINDLSRGCSVNDIVQLAAITSVEAQNKPLDICFLNS